jgi:hypothetical protein
MSKNKGKRESKSPPASPTPSTGKQKLGAGVKTVQAANHLANLVPLQTNSQPTIAALTAGSGLGMGGIDSKLGQEILLRLMRIEEQNKQILAQQKMASMIMKLNAGAKASS